MEGTEAAHIPVQVVFMAAGQAALVILAATLARAQFGLFGPELRVRFHQLIRAICNGTFYSNSKWTAA
jgi:hypothetical protein